MKECKGRAVVEPEGMFKVRFEGDLPDAPSRPAIVAVHTRNREPGWTPVDGEPVVCIVDRDESVHIVASGVIKQTVGLETPIGQSVAREPPPERRLCVYTAEVVSVGITGRWATIRQEGSAGMTLEKVPVAEKPGVVCREEADWFPQAGDRVLVLLEEYPFPGVGHGHVVIGPVLPADNMLGGPTASALRDIAASVKGLTETINKALDDWRGGRVGGKR
jgi:hypothetical protein